MTPLSRRNFARSAALVTLFAPFIDFLENKTARAAGAPAYDNLLLFFTPGTDVAAWTPRGSSDNNIVWSPMLEPLEPLKANLCIVEKLSSFGSASSHGSPGGLTGMNHGAPTHVSVEQFISDRLPATPIKNLLLGGVSSEQQTSFFRDGRALTPISSTQTAHQAIFNGFTPDGSSMPDPGGGMTPQERRRRSALDLVKGELATLSSQLGAAERQKLELHADSIRQLEQAMEGSSGGGSTGPQAECSVPGAPAAGSEPLLASSVHLDLAVKALACGRTRVAAVQFGHHQNTQVSLPEVGSPGDWHNTFMHSDMAPRTRLVELERWLCREFVRAAEQLKALPLVDGSGSLFDRTLMVWARDMGDGILHGGDDMRFVFAGGSGSYLAFSPNGRYIDGRGAHHQSALVSMCEAMGVTDYADFGDRNQPRAPVPTLSV
jgi:hypothetical protein